MERGLVELRKTGRLVRAVFLRILAGNLQLWLRAIHRANLIAWPEEPGIQIQTPLVRIEDDILVKLQIVCDD